MRTNKGFSLIELVIAIGIFATVVAGTTFFVTGSYTEFGGTGDDREMARFADEAMNALKIVKERSWADIATKSTDPAAPSSVKVSKNATGDWVLSTGNETRGSFTRSIYITNVQRDDSGAITTGTDDPSTKKVQVTVSASGRTDYSIQAYFINWEAFRMDQTDWGGSSGATTWTSGTTDYNSQTNMDLPTTSGNLSLSGS